MCPPPTVILRLRGEGGARRHSHRRPPTRGWLLHTPPCLPLFYCRRKSDREPLDTKLLTVFKLVGHHATGGTTNALWTSSDVAPFSLSNEIRCSTTLRHTCIIAAFKSEFIHSYGMFHPTAPNFLLSRISALKKTSEKHSFLNALALEHNSYSSSYRFREF